MFENCKLGKLPGVCICCLVCITKGLPRNSKSGVCSSLADNLNDLHRKATVIVSGNFDGHVGRASSDEAHGNNGYGVRNVEGNNIVKLAGSTNVKLRAHCFRNQLHSQSYTKAETVEHKWIISL